MADASAIEIRLGGFVDFVCARSTGRIAAVADTVSMYAEPYPFERDFYGPMRKAVLDGIANRDDVSRTNQVCESCSVRKKEHYQALTSGWQRWRRGKDVVVNPRGEDWRRQDLVVRVSPPIIVRSRNQRDLVWLYYKEPELTSDAARIANRIVELAIPSSIGRPAVLDIRRAKLHRASSPLPRGFDALLNAEVSAFTSLYEALRHSA
ncbi:hypothetical protein [Mycobacterium deserti]|uniref:Uncharacterized protein n=1 Tax=Mycobacterium deserti TaxID=2978347 RepID=A0ABT2M6Y3_9MYCO|nr:hypothetical protein [Mycobacterium deserti]MCT7658028.1 hypothetical protein [Mycobacterium deserti]